MDTRVIQGVTTTTMTSPMGARVVMPATAPRPETRAQAALGGVDRMERPPGKAVLRERPATT